MMSLRRLDEQGMRDYLEELRPRFVTLRLTTGKIRIWWGMPLWAFEEVLSFGLRLLPLLPHLTPLLPTRARAALGAWQTSNTEGLTAAVTTLAIRTGARFATLASRRTVRVDRHRRGIDRDPANLGRT